MPSNTRPSKVINKDLRLRVLSLLDQDYSVAHISRETGLTRKRITDLAVKYGKLNRGEKRVNDLDSVANRIKSLGLPDSDTADLIGLVGAAETGRRSSKAGWVEHFNKATSGRYDRAGRITLITETLDKLAFSADYLIKNAHHWKSYTIALSILMDKMRAEETQEESSRSQLDLLVEAMLKQGDEIEEDEGS